MCSSQLHDTVCIPNWKNLDFVEYKGPLCKVWNWSFTYLYSNLHQDSKIPGSCLQTPPLKTLHSGFANTFNFSSKAHSTDRDRWAWKSSGKLSVHPCKFPHLYHNETRKVTLLAAFASPRTGVLLPMKRELNITPKTTQHKCIVFLIYYLSVKKHKYCRNWPTACRTYFPGAFFMNINPLFTIKT